MSSVKDLKKILDKKYEKEDKPYTSWKDVVDKPKRATGSLLLDHVLGGGLVPGIISQWYGVPASGKTAIVTHLCGVYQKLGLPVLYVDSESGFDKKYARDTFGFDVEDENTCLFSQEENGAIIYDMIESAANSGFRLCVIDSTDAMFTDAEEEGEFGQAHMGQMARLNSQALKKLKGTLKRTGCDLMLISQTRTSIGGYTSGMEVISGGKALEFYASVRSRVSRVEIINNKDGDAIGQKIKIVNKKNKTGVPMRTCELDLYYNKGFDVFGEVVDLAITYGLIKKKGGWFEFSKFPNDKPIQGKDNVNEWFRSNTDQYDLLRLEVEDIFYGRKPAPELEPKKERKIKANEEGVNEDE